MKTISYDKKGENILIHYEVSYEEEEVKLLCEKLKNEAFHTIHYDYKSIHGPFEEENIKAKANIPTYPKKIISSYQKSSIMEEDLTHKILIPMYRFEYDVTYYPYLLALLGDILAGNMNSLEEITYPSFEKEYIPIRAEIENKENQYRNMDEKNDEDIVNQKLKILDELKEMLLKVKNGDYEIPIRPYYEEAQKLFDIKKSIVENTENTKNR